jgi:hypothetical protein
MSDWYCTTFRLVQSRYKYQGISSSRHSVPNATDSIPRHELDGVPKSMNRNKNSYTTCAQGLAGSIFADAMLDMRYPMIDSAQIVWPVGVLSSP